MKPTQGITVYILLILLGIFFSSCVSTKKTSYFNDVPDAWRVTSAISESQLINANDILSIQVSSLNPQATEIFNSNTTTTITGTNIQQTTGYLVDGEGNIQFPVLGKVKAAGMSKNQFTEELRKQLADKKLLLDPVVAVRFLNFRITVLGEVAHPMVVPVPNEKISILEAIGMAGDLTIYGKRENVLLIREEAGQKTMTRINLTSRGLFSSPFYYLKNGDVVYVEPNQAKVSSASNVRQVLPIVLSGLSFLAIIFDRASR